MRHFRKRKGTKTSQRLATARTPAFRTLPALLRSVSGATWPPSTSCPRFPRRRASSPRRRRRARPPREAVRVGSPAGQRSPGGSGRGPPLACTDTELQVANSLEISCAKSRNSSDQTTEQPDSWQSRKNVYKYANVFDAPIEYPELYAPMAATASPRSNSLETGRPDSFANRLSTMEDIPRNRVPLPWSRKLYTRDPPPRSTLGLLPGSPGRGGSQGSKNYSTRFYVELVCKYSIDTSERQFDNL